MRWRGWLRRWGPRAGPRRSCWRRSTRGCCPALTPALRGCERELRRRRHLQPGRVSNYLPSGGVSRHSSSVELLFDAGDLVGGPLVGVSGHVEALLRGVGLLARGGEAALELAALRLLAAAFGLLAGAFGRLGLLRLALAARRGGLALRRRLASAARLRPSLLRCRLRRRRDEPAHRPSAPTGRLVDQPPRLKGLPH